MRHVVAGFGSACAPKPASALEDRVRANLRQLSGWNTTVLGKFVDEFRVIRGPLLVDSYVR